MTNWYICNNCKIAFALFDGTEKRCSTCGGSGGEIISREQMKAGVEAGAYHISICELGSDPRRSRVRYWSSVAIACDGQTRGRGTEAPRPRRWLAQRGLSA
jgi:hypothetical protein